MVDRDDRKSRAALEALHGDGGLVEGGGDGVDGDRGERGGCVLEGMSIRGQLVGWEWGLRRTAETSHTTESWRSGTWSDSMLTVEREGQSFGP